MTPTRNPLTGEWEITVPPFTIDGETFDSYGPYPTRSAAEIDLRGLRRFDEIDQRETAAVDRKVNQIADQWERALVVQ